MARSFALSHSLVAAHGGAVVCLDERAVGRTFPLHSQRPGASLNERLTRAGIRSEVIGSDGATEAAPTAITRVDVRGPLEQRAGYHDPCGGWSDGHDAVAERLIAALGEGDVVMVIDSPGGAAAGLQEAVRRVVEAKAATGHKIIAFADEMIGSAAYWWAATVADEIYAPEAAVIGSIGARAAHASSAGALAQEGVAVTYFAWPGPGKVAFAPELPLSDLGKARGDRDVAIAGEAFAAAVAAARGITRDDIVALDADALSATAAVAAGLIDGVATLEDVLGYALTLSETNGEAVTAITERGNAMTIRAEGDDDDKGGGGADPVPSDCAKCGLKNEMDAKFCKGCGASMATAADDDGDDDAPDGDGKKPEPPAAAPPPAERQASTLAALAGLHAGASTPAIKSALLPVVGLAEYAMKLTETRTPAEARGALMALSEDAAAAGKLRTELRDLKRVTESRERMDLLRKLSAAALPGYTRGDLLVDDVDEASGKRTTKPAPVYAEMKLGTLRGLVDSKLKNAGPAAPRKAPFEPDAKAATGTGVTEQDRQIAARHGFDPERVAASRAALFANNGAPRATTGV